MDQNPHINEFHPAPIECGARLCLSNESLNPVSGEVVWSLRHADGSVIREGREKAAAGALTSMWLENLTFPEASVTGDYFSYSFTAEDGSVSSGSVLFCAPKHFEWVNPGLTVRREGDELIVAASAFAKSIEIRSEDPDLLLSDNYFDMNPGERRVRILRGTAENPSVRSVYDMAD